MENARAGRVVEALRARRVFAHVKPSQAGRTASGIRVVLPDGREAVWDTDGTAGLEAQVIRDGVLVGFVPSIPGSENSDEAQTVEAIPGRLRRPRERAPAPGRPRPRPGAGPRLPGRLCGQGRVPRRRPAAPAARRVRLGHPG